MTGHQHKRDLSKGIQIRSVRPLLDIGDIFFLSTGMTEDLGVNVSTVEYLKSYGKEVYTLQTEACIKQYNDYVMSGSKKNCVALLHSTC